MSPAAAGLPPLTLGPRDGLTLVNGTSVTTGLAAVAWDEATAVLRRLTDASAAGLEVIGGATDAFHPEVAGARAGADVVAAAAEVRAGLPDRITRRSPGPQDPYAWRCVPQVHGAAASTLGALRRVVDEELASCTDNPLLITGEGSPRLGSGGGFHAAALGLALDGATTAVVTAASLGRQRVVQLLSGLGGPVGLASGDPAAPIGLDPLRSSVTARLLEMQAFVPASSRTLPVDGAEDHVANATLAARQLRAAVSGARDILAAEVHCIATATSLAGLVPEGRALRWALDLGRRHDALAGPDRPASTALAGLAAELGGGR